MSNEPVDQWLARAGEDPGLAGAIERHLDDHPLHVDEAELQRVVDRVQQRIQPQRTRPWAWPTAMLVAAAVLLTALGTGVASRIDEKVESTGAHAAAGVEQPPMSSVPAFEVVARPTRRVELSEDADALVSESERSTVVLVRQGTAAAAGVHATAGQWLLATEDPAGAPTAVVFPDGSAPPPLHPDIWTESLQPQLHDLRVRSLPPRTLDRLDALLETP